MVSAATSQLTLHHEHVVPGCNACAVFENVCVHVWTATASEADGRHLLQLSRTLTQEFPGGVSSLHWILDGVGLPCSAVRGDILTVMREAGPQLGEVAVVLDGGGFWASAYRGVLTGLRMAAGERVGFQVFANVSGAAAFLSGQNRERTGRMVPAHAIETMALDLRGRI